MKGKASSLLSKLEAADSGGFHALFSEYLRPFFSDLRNNTTRSLASRFLPFLSRAFLIIVGCFKEPSKLEGKELIALELFDVFRLCFDCLEVISSHVKWGRSLYQLQRVSFVLDLLMRAAKGQCKDSTYYFRVLHLVDEARPWFRVLKADEYEKCHRSLVNNLKCSTISLVSKLKFYDKDLVCGYLLSTMAEDAKSTIKDQIYKFAHGLCSSLLSLEEDRPSFTIDVLTCLLDSLASDGKLELENNELEFFKLVDCCANKCRSRNPKLYSAIGAYVNAMADDISKHFEGSNLDCWQRSRILMGKARTLRSFGLKYMKDCTQCLSDAISLLEVTCHELCGYGIQPCHQLAAAYCLRALCSHEAQPNSKQVLKDVEMALDLWSRTIADDRFSIEDKCLVMSENVLIMLYNLTDLLALKGCMDLYCDVNRLMIRLFQWKNIPLEKLLPVLWECRRGRHSLCVLPLSDTLLVSLSDHFGEHSKSIDFWISCLRGSQPLLVGFQHNFSILFASFLQGSCNRESSFRSEITVDEVKDAASSCSDFIASHLYYDLSERLISNGQIIEALFYAKEAHSRRAKLFGEKYYYFVEKFEQNMDADKEFAYEIQDFQVRRGVACKFWSFDSVSWDLQSSYLSPWIVLQCYLESTLQVGIVHELIGNGDEAEAFFLWGKRISCSQSLPIFMVAFSSALCILYRKKQLWDVAEKEFHGAREHLQAASTNISCKKCRLLLEVTVDQNLADLSQSIIESSLGRSSAERSFDTESLYKSALNKLNDLVGWENFVIRCKEGSTGRLVLGKGVVKDVKQGYSNAPAHSEENQWDSKKPSRERLRGERVGRKCTETRNAPVSLSKNQDSMHGYNLRSSRSKYQTSQNQSISGEIEVSRKHLSGRGENDCSGTSSQSDLLLEIKSCGVASSGEDVCVCKKMRCWYCLPMEVIKRGLLSDFLNMKWEFARRRLSLKLLAGLGNCLESRGQIHEAHEIIFQSISIFVRPDYFHLTPSTVSFTLLLDIIGKEIVGDMFSIERAEILYNICRLCLTSYHSRDARIICCYFSHMSLVKLVAWLMLAFVLCREVPVLFQKVSRLLAVIFSLSSSNKLFSFTSSCKSLSESHWASYFHQASVGTHFSYHSLIINGGRYKVQHLADAKGGCPSCSGSVGTEDTWNLPRLAPESVQDLEDFVETFFVGLPCATAVCISLLGGPSASLLQELLHHSCIKTWLLISRLDSKNQPIVLLLPVNSILKDAATSGISDFSQGNDLDKHWQCPWGSALADELAPEFRIILEENYLTYSLSNDTNKELMWKWKKKLDDRLGKFIRNIEDSWLGPWKCVILGERSDFNHLDLVHKKLVRDLKFKCKMDIDESILKLILGGLKDISEKWTNILLSYLNKGCYVGGIEFYDQERCSASSNDTKAVGNLYGLALEFIHEAVNELENGDCVDREPIILVKIKIIVKSDLHFSE